MLYSITSHATSPLKRPSDNLNMKQIDRITLALKASGLPEGIAPHMSSQLGQAIAAARKIGGTASGERETASAKIRPILISCGNGQITKTDCAAFLKAWSAISALDACGLNDEAIRSPWA